MKDSHPLNNDPVYLRKYQYQDAANLEARIAIHKRFSTGKSEWNDFVFDLLELREGMRVLELGSGSGALWRVILGRLPDELTIFLSDFSLGMATQAVAGLTPDPRFHVLCQDAMALAFPPRSVDLVIANHMLYHVASRGLAIANISRVLCSGGRLVCATNGPGHMRDLDELLAEFEPAYRGMHAMSSSFNLENGEEQLRPHFALVELVMYPSDLWVTDAAQLAAYAYSTPLVKATISRARQQDMMDFFQQRIAQDGGIAIRKQTGLFLASKPLD